MPEVPSRQEEREERARVAPILPTLNDIEGIDVALSHPIIGDTLRVLGHKLLHKDWPNTTISLADRELIATRVSALNNCFYCMDSHGTFAEKHLDNEGKEEASELVDSIKCDLDDVNDPKLKSLLKIAECITRMEDTEKYVNEALNNNASTEDINLVIYISGTFCMYNRFVEGFRAKTPADISKYEEVATRIISSGYIRN